MYAIGAFFTLLIIFSVPLYKTITAPPLCTDGKQNGDERGIDCGGACALFCARDAQKPIVHWARAFKVSNGIYDTVAYVENPNKEAGVKNALYTFKTYDAENILITETIGKTFLLPGEAFPIFSPAVRTGSACRAIRFLVLRKNCVLKEKHRKRPGLYRCLRYSRMLIQSRVLPRW